MRLYPQDIKAEQALISSMILDNRIIDDVLSKITSDYFSRMDHQAIFENIQILRDNRVSIDLITLSDKLPNNSHYISEITTEFYTVYNYNHYLDIIVDKYELRQLAEYSSEIIRRIEESDEPKEYAQTHEFDFRKSDEINPSMALVAFEELEYMREMHESKKPKGLKTGFNDLDYLLDGLKDGDLITIGARPSMGKSTLAVNIINNIAKSGKVVQMFSLEMNKRKLMQRMAFSLARVSMRNYKNKCVSESQWSKITNAVADISNQKIFVHEESVNVLQIKSKAKRLKKKHGLDLLVIDHLGLLDDSKKHNSENDKIGFETKTLKRLAGELNCPIIILSQLSRAIEQRPIEHRRPQLSDLRNSGNIEQDSDVVMFLFRDEYYTKEETKKPGIGEVIIAKNRDGELGVVELAFFGEMTRFENLSRG